MEEDDQHLMDSTLDGLGIPRGTSMWPFTKKPLDKATGKSGGKSSGKSTGKPSKSSAGKPMRSKSHKPSRGSKHKKNGIFSGWY